MNHYLQFYHTIHSLTANQTRFIAHTLTEYLITFAIGREINNRTPTFAKPSILIHLDVVWSPVKSNFGANQTTCRTSLGSFQVILSAYICKKKQSHRRHHRLISGVFGNKLTFFVVSLSQNIPHLRYGLGFGEMWKTVLQPQDSLNNFFLFQFTALLPPSWRSGFIQLPPGKPTGKFFPPYIIKLLLINDSWPVYAQLKLQVYRL